MKNVVTRDEFRDVELGPAATYKRYQQLLEREVPIYFKKKGKNKRKHCPACSSREFIDQFSKLNFDYQTCIHCGSMFVCYPPEDHEISLYYEQSESYRLYVEEYLSNFEKEKTETWLEGYKKWKAERNV